MHPKQTYTNEQAREVLRAVRAFMQQLATLIWRMVSLTLAAGYFFLRLLGAFG